MTLNKWKVRCSPEPEELWENGSNEAVNEDVRPHQLAGKLKGLKARVVKQEEARPQQQQVEQTHKPWETHRSSSSDVSQETFCQPRWLQLHGIKIYTGQEFGSVFVHKQGANIAKNIVNDWNNCNSKYTLLKDIYTEHLLTKEHGNVELILPIHSSLDHNNVDSVQHRSSQRPQRPFTNI